QFPPDKVELSKELEEVKERITAISQKKLRPIIEEVLGKNPAYLANISHLRTLCPWCYKKSREVTLHISSIRKIVKSSFDRLELAPGRQRHKGRVSKSHISELVIEVLGLFVNIEPSPHFLQLHAQETHMIEQAKGAASLSLSADSDEELLNKQYNTYKNHLHFLHNSIDYYRGISDRMEFSSTMTPIQ
ncbi:hypothetical protein JW979_05040, partial [bacterium]|nr:hypothetical protein [candidate division CSSED10-310 bacterium]